MNNDDEIPKHRSKKNTKKWCKGKVGKLHQFMWKNDKDFYSIKLLQYSCVNCGKVETTFYNFDKQRFEEPQVGSTSPLREKEIKDGSS